MVLVAAIDIIEITASFYWKGLVMKNAGAIHFMFAMAVVGFAWMDSRDGIKAGRRQEMKRKIKPLGNRILVEPWEPKGMVEGGIVIPEIAQEKTNQAVVAEVGEGRMDKAGKRVSIDLKPGDRVLLNRYGGTDVGLEGKTYKIVDADDLLAVLILPPA